MAFHSDVDLVLEFQRFASSDCEPQEEEMSRQQRFHLHISRNPDYDALLAASLEKAAHGSQFEQLVCAEYLAYLLNFHPEAELSQHRLAYMNLLSGGLHHSEQARWGYAMLIVPDELIRLVEGVEQRIEDFTTVSYTKELATILEILKKKLEWELKRRRIARSDPQPILQQFVDRLMNFLCSRNYANHEEILLDVAKLTALAMSYLKEETLSYKAMLLHLMEYWLTLKVYKPEVKTELIKSLTISLSCFGIYKIDLFYQFFTANAALIQEIEYLELLEAFLGKLDKSQRLNQSEITKILKSLFSATLQSSSGPAARCYRSKALVIDQIIKISTLFSCDLTKHLSRLFQQARSASHEALMGALMLVFDQRISTETIDTIDSQKLHYLKKTKQCQMYEGVLKQYCDQNLELQQLLANPELTDDFMWELLLLKTIVAINYSALCEIDKVANLVINLIKLVLLDIFAQECLDIIERILEKEAVYSLRELEQASMSAILEAVRPILMKQVDNQIANNSEKFASLYQNLEKVVEMINKRHKVEELSGFRLFLTVIRLSNSLPDRYATPAFMKHQNRLLETAMPMDFAGVSEEELGQALQELLNHLKKYRENNDYLLYLEMMSRGIEHPQLHRVYLHMHEKIQGLQWVMNLPANINDSYKINYFMLSGRELSQEILDNSWSFMSRLASLHYPHLFFHILDLFRYAARWVAQNCPQENQVAFLKYQLARTEAVARNIDQLLQKVVVLERMEELLSFRQALLMFLQETMLLYREAGYSVCEELTAAGKYLFKAFQDMKGQRPSTLIFEQRPAIREYWCNCQLLVLIMTASALRQQKERKVQLVGMLMEIDEKFEWICKLYPKEHERQLQEFALCLNCELFELNAAVSSRFMAMGV